MDLVVEVRDAAGAALADATVVLKAAGGTASGVSDASGRFGFGPMPTAPFTVEVSRAAYLDEQVEVIPVGSGSIWSNPVCTRTAAALVVRLSRLRAAPTEPVSNADLESRPEYDPRAVFTFVDGGNRTDRYVNLSDVRLDDFHLARTPMLPATVGEGWGRLNHETRSGVDPGRDGDLVWLEWGLGGTEPRLAVAAWLPRFRGTTPSTLDFVIFLSPPTAKPGRFEPDSYPWLGKYPYWARKVPGIPQAGRDGLYQTYVSTLVWTYMFRGKWLAHQLLAAGRQPVFLFPVQPWGVWGPFGQAPGLARLVAEVTHFMHRTGHTGGGQTNQELTTAPRPGFRQGANRYHEPPPRPGRIVLSGFSAGMLTVVNLLGAAPGERLTYRPLARPKPTTEQQRREIEQERKLAEQMARGMPQELFGAEPTAFLGAWKEVWDCDAEDAARRAMDTALHAWMKRDGERMARCYQTAHTGSDSWLERSPLREFAPDPTHAAPGGAGAASERHSRRCSLVYWGHGYLDHPSSTTGVPEFWNAPDMHHAVPMLAFAHAASLSGLAKR